MATPTSETAPAEAPTERVPVETLLAPLPAWEQAALRVAGNWPRGQQITCEEFEQLRKKTLEGAIR